MAINDPRIKIEVDLSPDGVLRLKMAIECLKRIASPRSSFKDHPGRTWPYSDFELRQIAKRCLKEMDIDFDPK